MLKMEYIPKGKVEYYKTRTEKHRQKTPWQKSQQDLFWSTS